MSGQEKKAYRRAIWFEWRKIVVRKKLTSYEYKLIEGYFADGVPVEIIIRAIKQACNRARANGSVVYSLGFINRDIDALKRQTARMHVGDSPRSSASSAVQSDWHSPFERRLDIAIDEAAFCPVMQENLRGLKRDFGLYSEGHTQHLFEEILEEGCGMSDRSPSPHQAAHRARR